MDWIDKLSAMLTAKAMAATSAATAVGGLTSERVPLLAEGIWFQIFGWGVTMPAIAMGIAILSGGFSLYRSLTARPLRRDAP